ncbi:MAG: hypothetical protein GY699_16775 [Desulfobacteraceae bacterium]|nr:hypothetical protein [Desulfobacteraceae bacterium]
MKFFPIKIAIICILATPFLYILSLTSFEKYLTKTYSNQIQNILIGDSKKLLDGSIRLEEQITKNIHDFLKENWLVQNTKLDINILVTTTKGRIIYPTFIDVNSLAKELGNDFDSDRIAKNNFDILNSELIVKIETSLSHGSIISNLILVVYFGIAFLIFFKSYKIGSSKAAIEQRKKVQQISDLKKEEQIHKQILNDLKNERQGLFENIKALNAKYQEDKAKAKINEEEMFDEIISLEEQMNSFIELKQTKEEEINELKSKIQKYERRKGSKNKRLEFDFIIKRFSALYKNIVMNRKALSGFISLNEDQQIKAEESILLLDRNPKKITIKRKVFSGKRHKTACFEVLFAYNGRLYFKKNSNGKTEILVIGTKNTQLKDMEFLHNL